ncbi:MAG: O-antigen ligase family protein [Patescibacteria group bacterium]
MQTERYRKQNFLNTTFEILWRLSIFLLPWQTRWFQGAKLGGWNWEQGSASVYASWLLIMSVVILGFWQKRKKISPILTLKISGAMFVFVAISILASNFEDRALIAIIQWWLQVSLLFFFALTIYQAGISVKKLAFWFILSLIPQILLGFWQYYEQLVVGSKWLGIAAQLPENQGVSVIEHGLFRVLRIYGGFPHPNIFGGWVAIGFIVSLWLAATAVSKWRALSFSLISCFLSVAILLSYARSAWIAASVGVLVLFIIRIRRLLKTRQKTDSSEFISFQFFIIALVSSIFIASAVAVTQADHLATRFNPAERLEAKSLEARFSGLRLGLEILKNNLWLGTGPNAELTKAVSADEKLSAPIEPPHNVFFLALIDFGLVGLMLMIVFLAGSQKAFVHKLKEVFMSKEMLLPVISSLFFLSLFDHYLWSLWSGQVLLMFGIMLAFKKETDHPSS